MSYTLLKYIAAGVGYCLFVPRLYQSLQDDKRSTSHFLCSSKPLSRLGHGESVMKTENRNAELYLAPEIETIDILPEGIFCTSDKGETEDGGYDGELGYYVY